MQSRRCTHTHTGVRRSCTNSVCFGFNTSDGTASRSFTPPASAGQLATGRQHAGTQVLPKRRGGTGQWPLAEPHTHCDPSLTTAIPQATLSTVSLAGQLAPVFMPLQQRLLSCHPHLYSHHTEKLSFQFLETPPCSTPGPLNELPAMHTHSSR